MGKNAETKMEYTTDELLKLLRSVNSVSNLSEYTENLPLPEEYQSFSAYFNYYMRSHEILEGKLIRESQIQRNYAYQILNGTKNPSRDKVLALCIAARMELEDVQRALGLADAGKLYPRLKRDSIIIFALHKKLTVQQTNELLFAEGEETLT